jgi:hypothetical protein
MQVKPHFESYKILEQHPILKDDTGNEMCLTLFEVKLKDNENEVTETAYQFWRVVGKTQIQHNNKAISYECEAYWNANQRKNMYKGVVNGFLVEEAYYGVHNVFNKVFDRNDPDEINKLDIKTSFKLKRI